MIAAGTSGSWIVMEQGIFTLIGKILTPTCQGFCNTLLVQKLKSRWLLRILPALVNMVAVRTKDGQAQVSACRMPVRDGKYRSVICLRGEDWLLATNFSGTLDDRSKEAGSSMLVFRQRAVARNLDGDRRPMTAKRYTSRNVGTLTFGGCKPPMPLRRRRVPLAQKGLSGRLASKVFYWLITRGNERKKRTRLALLFTESPVPAHHNGSRRKKNKNNEAYA
mmetsp:Transcript_44344/g.76635  ORF Transcript_44344/g.76635 Transcript_44344/m.76635 type:complete len:221 (-) Transcript_44344:1302-1964(-)